ncbi:MAG: MFS transporter, partial [Caldanaerobacter sp.]
MNKLGLTPKEIGYLATFNFIGRFINSLYAGVITDRLGRKITLFIFDILAWPLAFFIWAISNNFILFLIGVLLNSFVAVADTAWKCILVEDANPQERKFIFAFLKMIFVIGGMVVPLFSILIAKYHIVVAIKIVLVVGAIGMLGAIIVRNFFLTETVVGVKIKAISIENQYNSIQKIKEALKYI